MLASQKDYTMKRNFVDRAIEFVAPRYALQRYHARAVLGVVDKKMAATARAQARRYDAAAKGRHTSDWYSPALSINQEVLAALEILRERSRELCRNNAYAINAVRTIKNNVIGAGVRPTPVAVKGITKSRLKIVEQTWNAWADKTGCDYDDQNTFYGLQSLAMKVVVESGECIIRKVRGTSTDIVPLRLQIMEGDFINSSYHTGIWQDDNTLTYYGIKFDRSGRRIGYWLYKHHPSEFGTESEFVPASDIIHIYDTERPGQIRGVPMGCGAMLRLKDLEDYEFTERTRNKVAAAFAVFITDPTGTDNGNVTGVDDNERIEPGMIKTLLPGQEIAVANPPSNQGFAEYVKSNLRGISAGFGMSYEALSNDYSNVNFSSGKMGSMEFNNHIEHLQWNMVIPKFCAKVFPWFIEACQLKGIIPFTSEVDATWTPPRRQMIDTYKEIQGLEKGLRAGIYSWSDVVKTLGMVPSELAAELEEDKKMWDRLGLQPSIDPRFDPNRHSTEEQPPDNDEPTTERTDENKDQQ